MNHPYKAHIDKLLEESLSTKDPSTIDAASLYAVRGGGRIRPLIIYEVAKALKSSISVDPIAISIELLHSASLIADDLPCMDNDFERRGKKTCHVVYGQEVALLASYKLIAIAYEALTEIDQSLSLERHLRGLQIISSKCAEMVQGQLHDLRQEEIKSASKTTALFQAAFSLGWIYGGGAFDQIELIEKAAFAFGQAFQTADDLDDKEVSEKKGRIFLEKNLLNAKEALKNLGLFTPNMAQIFGLFKNRCYSELTASAT